MSENNKEKTYKFKCPHCGGTDGIYINGYGSWSSSASRFSAAGYAMDETVDSHESEDSYVYCSACEEEISWSIVEANLIEAHDGEE